MTQYCISWVAVMAECQAKNGQDRDKAASRTVGTSRPCRAAVHFLFGNRNSQAHDFSMRAPLTVQIGQTSNIVSLHRQCAWLLVDNAQWQYQFNTSALKSGKKSDQLLQTRYKWAFPLRKNNVRSKIGQALI
ncbi:hypothetical protein [Janthinobacterium sp. RT4P48]|uniref:hypothetical protein n=1 Tax=Janthinobacterium sp. RT4P48 TaxID=3424188 RepID=UPI003F211ACA